MQSIERDHEIKFVLKGQGASVSDFESKVWQRSKMRSGEANHVLRGIDAHDRAGTPRDLRRDFPVPATDVQNPLVCPQVKQRKYLLRHRFLQRRTARIFRRMPFCHSRPAHNRYSQRLKARVLLTFALVLVLAAACPARTSVESGNGWQLATERNGVTIYSRPYPGSSFKEFKAVGEIAAATRVVSQVLEDVDAYPKFMPYMAECRLLGRGKDWLHSYQRISPKICADRDFTLRTRITRDPAGLVYSNRWECANALGPPRKPGVVRVERCNGAWLLESAGAEKTRATYLIYTDIGGLIPAFVANHFSVRAIVEIFTAVRKQARDPKYAATIRPI
jgi:hypothetical protein